MVHLGDRLGLYRALADAGEPLTSVELAERTGLDERWVREWAYNQAAAKLIDAEGPDGHERFSLSPEAVAVLADADSPAFGMGQFTRLPGLMATLDSMPEAFRTGLGYDYDSHGEDGAASVERSFEPWYRNYLIPVALPALDGVVPRLEAGGTAADVGCGAGVAVCLMATAFPASEIHGYDISRLALERAEPATGGLRADQRPLPRRPRPSVARGRLGRSRDHLRLRPRHDPSTAGDGGHQGRPPRRRGVAAGRHEGPRFLRRERGQEPHGAR